MVSSGREAANYFRKFRADKKKLAASSISSGGEAAKYFRKFRADKKKLAASSDSGQAAPAPAPPHTPKPRPKKKAKKVCVDGQIWVEGYHRKCGPKKKPKPKPMPAVIVDKKGEPISHAVVKSVSVAVPNSGLGKKGRRVQSLVVASAPTNPAFAASPPKKSSSGGRKPSKAEMRDKGRMSEMASFFDGMNGLSEAEMEKRLKTRYGKRGSDWTEIV